MTMKKMLSLLLAGVLTIGLFGGCATEKSAVSEEEQESSAKVLELKPPKDENLEDTSKSSQQSDGSKVSAEEDAASSDNTVRLAALKGPTSMGLVKLLEDASVKQTKNQYAFTMTGTADEIVAQLAKGSVDIAAVPCNLASVLYNNTQGKVKLAAINTLGALYIVETGDTIQSIADLKGKTILSTGKGTTPEFALNYILSQNGLDPLKDVTIEYKSESTEVAAQLATMDNAIALLPEPYVTTVKMQNSKLRTALSLADLWDQAGGGSSLVAGVVVVHSDFLTSNPAAVASFLEEYQESIDYVNENIAQAALLVEKYGIAPQAVAEQAIPNCNIRYIDGAEMKTKVSGYLQALFDQNPKMVGGKMPDDAFYYEK